MRSRPATAARQSRWCSCARNCCARCGQLCFHPFGPGQGITGVLLLAESHTSIHTWPEHGYAAVDVFMCGDARPMVAIALIRDRLGAPRRSVRECSRGAQQADLQASEAQFVP